jgi:hypothetical protein
MAAPCHGQRTTDNGPFYFPTSSPFSGSISLHRIESHQYIKDRNRQLPAFVARAMNRRPLCVATPLTD